MEPALAAAGPQIVEKQAAALDDSATLCAISVLACMLSTMLHEGLGHAAVAITTLNASGTLTSLAWSSTQDSRLVAAAGTLVNLASALVFWLLLRAARNANPALRFFFLITMSFNLLTGTGYFFYSGVSNFGDWAQVIDGLQPHWLWRTGLIVLGVITYYLAIRIIGGSIVRYMGVPLSNARRFRRLTWLPYFSAIVIDGVAALFNPFGMRYVFLSALAATAGGHSGLLWLRYYIPRSIQPGGDGLPVLRSYAWIIVAVICAAVFIGVFGPGVHLAG
ncbi:MAG TPA: hypothetical protein VFW25_00735 [Silvibacterium sp.]|nr:hypothetical protein [Silvibacterium sp.]